MASDGHRTETQLSMMRIEQLPARDWERFRVIRFCALAEDPDAFCSKLSDEISLTPQDWIDRLTRANTATLVAVSDQAQDIGLAVAAPYDNAAGLFSMWVAPEARGIGIGGALIDSVVAWCRDRGHKRLLLDVADSNRPAIALYASKGFLPTGVGGTLPRPREHVSEHQLELKLTGQQKT